MADTTLFQPSLLRFFNNAGAPADGAKMYMYVTETTTDADWCTDTGGGSPGTNPLVADGDGNFANIYLDNSIIYRIKCTNSTGSQTFFDGDPISASTIADLAAAAGADLVGSTQDIATPTTLTLQDRVRFQTWTLEDKGGGTDKTAVQNSAAWDAILAAFDSGGVRGTVEFGEGEYLFNAALTFPTYGRDMMLVGHGKNKTILRQNAANSNGIALPDGVNYSVTVRDLTLQGAGTGTSYSGTGVGVYQNDTSGNDSFGINLDNVWIINFGSYATKLPRVFNSNFRDVYVNYCGNGHYIDGNSMNFLGCYVLNLPEADAVGYKVISGSATFISCNGVNDCDVWLQGGTSTIDGDAADAYATITLIGCNIENFNTIGVDLRNGNLNVFGSPFTGKASTSNLQAIRTRPNSSISYLDNCNAFILQSGASWKNSCAVHALNDLRPFSVIGGGETGSAFTYYDENGTAAYTMPMESTFQDAFGIYGRLYNTLKVTGNLRAAGNLVVATQTPASAAATGTAGTIAWDSSYIYVCTATDTWKRVAIATW